MKAAQAVSNLPETRGERAKRGRLMEAGVISGSMKRLWN
jgi:hypothetical protein